VFPAEWLVRRDESLRVVSDELWQAAHARVQQTVKSYLRRGHQLVGKVESTKGSYLLSGFLSCGLCKKPLIATRRGRNLDLVYFCREHKERGDAGCTNATGVPAIELHHAVIASLRDTFTPETFTAHLERMAGDVDAQAQRAAERAGLIADLPKLAAAEQRLVRRIGTVEDDALVAALKNEWQETQGRPRAGRAPRGRAGGHRARHPGRARRGGGAARDVAVPVGRAAGGGRRGARQRPGRDPAPGPADPQEGPGRPH
jgi:Recombinase zinc beta ribbon domain